jgi:hypothetical protein
MALSENVKSLLSEVFGDRAKESKLSPTLRGKTIVVYGTNNVGKTQQSSKFKNPIFMPFEKGMNGTSGNVVLQNTNWADVKKNIKLLSSKKMKKALDSGEQMTVIWDGFEKAGFYCQKFIEEKYDVFDIAEGNGGYGLWKQYEKEFWMEVDQLLAIGYTVVFIGHIATNKELGDILYPAGDKRCVKPIVDNADIVAYIHPNGVDDVGKEIPSSAYLVQTDKFYGRSRFTYVDKYIPKFTAENLEKAIVDGIKKELEIKGETAVDYDEQQKIYEGEEITYDQLIEDIKQAYLKLRELESLEAYDEIVSEHLGEGKLVSEASKKQLQPLMCIKDDLIDKIHELESEQE